MSERRNALKVIAGCAGAAITATAVVPAIGLVVEPGLESSSGPGGWTRVARIDALEIGHPTRANVIGPETDAWTRAPDRKLGSVWLIKESDSVVRAYSSVCPHLGCAIEMSGDHFNCPCHDSGFALNGRVLSGPSPRGMDSLDVRIEAPWVSVRYMRFLLGKPARIPG